MELESFLLYVLSCKSNTVVRLADLYSLALSAFLSLGFHSLRFDSVLSRKRRKNWNLFYSVSVLNTKLSTESKRSEWKPRLMSVELMSPTQNWIWIRKDQNMKENLSNELTLLKPWFALTKKKKLRSALRFFWLKKSRDNIQPIEILSLDFHL